MEEPGNVTPAPAQQPQTPQTPLDPRFVMERSIRGGGSWFYWIAAMTLINTISAQLKISGHFVIGAFATQLFDYLAVGGKHAVIKIIMIGLSLFITGIYAAMGVFSLKKQTWAFITGLVLYALDTLLMFAVVKLSGGSLRSILFSIVFHAWALYGIVIGLKANIAFNKLQPVPVVEENQVPVEV